MTPEEIRNQARIEEIAKERDNAKAELEALRIHCLIADQCLDEFYGIVSRYAEAAARLKILESDWVGWPDLQREWFGDKYAAMQPLEAVRARIEDSEARIERLTRERDEAKRKRDDQTKEIYAYVQSIHELKAEREQLLARVKRLEEESESRWLLAQSAIGSCTEMSSRVQRLEVAGDAMAANEWCEDHLASAWKEAKEATP